MSDYWWGGNKPLKKQVKIVPKKFDVKDLKEKFSSAAYYKSCIALMKNINNMLGLPETWMDISIYEKEYDKIVEFILDHYTIRDHMGLTAKMATLAAPMKLVGYNGNFIHRKKQLLQLPIKMQPADKVIIPWDKMKNSVLSDAFDKCQNPSGRIVLLAYMHGYPLRLHEIVNTSIKHAHRSKYNFLDVKNLKWHILKEHSKTRTPRVFDITREFCDDIVPYIPISGFLVARKNGNPYSESTHLKNLDIYGFKVNDVRNSYETYNYSRTDITDDQKQKISTTVLAHSVATALAHYTRNELANRMQKEIDNVSSLDNDDTSHD